MENQEYIAKLNGTAEAWNEWRRKEKTAPDLSDLDLMNSRLAGFDLHGANLRSAGMVGTDLTGTNLRETDLRGVDLTVARSGLRTEQLAGADLTGAKLPDELQKLYEKLDNVNNISESARKLFLVVLGACLYSWLTIATTTDPNLITNRASSPLPIIQTSIPIVGFYVVAPLLVLCVYFYFHFYLQKLWEELGSLPAIFPDGRALHTRIDPWLLNDLIRAHFPKLNLNRPFLSYFQLWISVLLAWWVVPITLFLFWGRYLPRQDKIWTTFHVVLFTISTTAALCLYRLAVSTLRGVERRPFRWRRMITSRRGYQTTAFAASVGVLFGAISWGARWGAPSNAPILGIPLTLKRYDIRRHETGYLTWVPRLMALVSYSPFANLTNADVSEKKPAWRKNDKNLDSVVGAQLGRANLRYALADGAFFAGANLNHADLRGADLRGAELSDAELDYAHLSGADLSHADLSGADLKNTHLSGAYLNEANLRGADLRYANLSEAKLEDADLSEANLSGGADLRGADLRGADLTYTILFKVRNLDLETMKKARNLDKAFYDDDILIALGIRCDRAHGDPRLPCDHNYKLSEQRAIERAKEREEQELQQKQNAGKATPNLSQPNP